MEGLEMTHEEAMAKLYELCAEYNVDYAGQAVLAELIIPMADKDMAMQIVENELKRRGKKE